VVEYLARYNVTPPQPGPWRPSPVPETGYVHNIYWLCDRYQRAGGVPTVADCQRELLTGGCLTRAWQTARERAAADGGAVILERADTVAAVQAVFPVDGAEQLASVLWADARAWSAAWQDVATRDPEVLAVMQLGQSELDLLDADD
jgi:hypothetical protein